MDKWASSHLPLVNKGRERGKKANRQLHRHFLSVGRGVYPTTTSWGDALKLKTSLFSFKVNTKRLSTVKMYVYNQAGQTAPHNCTFETFTMLNYSFKTTILTQVHPLFLKRSSWGISYTNRHYSAFSRRAAVSRSVTH